MIKAVIFDMDGLLIDSEPFWRRAQVHAFGTVGVELSQADMQSTMGRRVDDVVEHWWQRKPWQGATRQDVEALIVNMVIDLVRSEGKPLPGVMQVLDDIKATSMPMAIASSSSPEIIDAVIETLDIGNYFQHTYSGQHETYGKPHPGVFITTANHLSVLPHECLVFEDSPSGVLAAKAAKMTCVAVPSSETRKDKCIMIADRVLDSLEDFNEELLNELTFQQ